jgi:hypothetical protein
LRNGMSDGALAVPSARTLDMMDSLVSCCGPASDGGDGDQS